jgi:hypothetical protein
MSGACSRQRITPIGNDRDVVADADAAQQPFQCRIGHLVPQRPLFELQRIEITSAGDVAGGEGIHIAAADFEQAPIAGRPCCNRPARDQAGDPGWGDELAPARQVAPKATRRRQAAPPKRSA